MPVSLPLVAIERASGSVSEICLSSLFIISALIALSRTISSFSFSILLLNCATFALLPFAFASLAGGCLVIRSARWMAVANRLVMT
jgi:hypothetical protein